MQGEGQPLTGEELYGTAKKWTRELEQLPLHSHGAVIQAMQIAYEHRNLTMKREEVLRQQRMQEQQLENQRRAIELQEKMQQQRDADNLRQTAAATAQPQ